VTFTTKYNDAELDRLCLLAKQLLTNAKLTMWSGRSEAWWTFIVKLKVVILQSARVFSAYLVILSTPINQS